MYTTRDLWIDEKGATAVEFALVGSMLFMTLVFIMSIGLTIYYNQTLDMAAYRAGRQIMLGNVQNASLGKDDFRTTIVCPNLPAFFDCGKVIVNVQTIAQDTTQAAQTGGYYTLVNSTQTALIVPTSNGDTQYSPGVQKSYEYVQIVYPVTFLPGVFGSVLGGGATYNGSPAVMLVSTSAFRNEQY